LAAGRVEMYIAIVTLDSLGWLVMRHPKQMIKTLFLHLCNQIGIKLFCLFFRWGYQILPGIKLCEPVI
jgi:hypothetical protein